MTAIEFAPLLTAYSVSPSGESVTADVAAPRVLPAPGSMPGRRARVDLGDDPVGRRVDDRDLVGVVLRHIERGLRCVERHPERVAVELDALDQVARRSASETSTTTTSRSRSDDT